MQVLKDDGPMKKLGFGWQKGNLEADTLAEARAAEQLSLDYQIRRGLEECLNEIQLGK